MAKRIRRFTHGSGKTIQRAREGESAIAESSSRSDDRQCDIEGGNPGKLLSPAKKRRAAEQVQESLDISERRVCRVLEQPRSTQRQLSRIREDEPQLREHIVHLACQYGRYGYRRITALLRNGGWIINHKHVERKWQQKGLKVPIKQPKRRRLWLKDGSCIRLRPEYPKHVWSYDLMADRTSNGKPIRIFNIIDEYSRECLSVSVDRKMNSYDVIEQLAELFV